MIKIGFYAITQDHFGNAGAPHSIKETSRGNLAGHFGNTGGQIGIKKLQFYKFIELITCFDEVNALWQRGNTDSVPIAMHLEHVIPAQA